MLEGEDKSLQTSDRLCGSAALLAGFARVEGSRFPVPCCRKASGSGRRASRSRSGRKARGRSSRESDLMRCQCVLATRLPLPHASLSGGPSVAR